MHYRSAFAAVAVASLALTSDQVGAQNGGGLNIVLNVEPTAAVLSDLGRYGTVRDIIPELRAVTLASSAGNLRAIRRLAYVRAANPDAVRHGSPVDTVEATNFTNGLNTWDLDAVNVTDLAKRRTSPYTGRGVYVAVLDSGLLDSWRQYFPQQRIAVQYAKAFSGGGGDVGNVSSPTNQWEHDQNSHGTHVTSTILGYNLGGTAINGVAPAATVIPVKVLNQAGFGFSSVIARGIVYVAELKAGPLADVPVVINMSLGGPVLDAVEQAAIDYAISKGVVIVASAGNEGEDGMGFPGAYAPVISVAASGWVGEWAPGADGDPSNWWVADDVRDPLRAADFYITDFSSRQLPGQQLDVAAPGSWVLGPFQAQSGKTSYFFLGGTSMASPHVAGIAALMLEKKSGLKQWDVEDILIASAVALPDGCRTVAQPDGPPQTFCWGKGASGSGLATADAALASTR
jgi:subtilisin family serine protease